jgi:hypothetical protein
MDGMYASSKVKNCMGPFKTPSIWTVNTASAGSSTLVLGGMNNRTQSRVLSIIFGTLQDKQMLFKYHLFGL